MVFETYSRRKSLQSRNGEPEIYTYVDPPPHLRHQICLAISEGIGRYCQVDQYSFDVPPNANDWWLEIDRVCRKELESYLSFLKDRDLAERFRQYVRRVEDTDDFLSAVEIGCLMLSALNDDYHEMDGRGAQLKGIDAVVEINTRFEQHAFGYQFENGNIIRIDSKLAHVEIIKPALVLLSEPLFAKANDDFMTAHRHYRTNEFKDCVTASNRAFESMLKAICDAERWEYEKGARASDTSGPIS